MPTPPLQTRFSTVAEVAAMLRVSKMTVYRMCERGEIPHVRIGRSMRIPTAGIWRYLADQELIATDAPYDRTVGHSTPVNSQLRAV